MLQNKGTNCHTEEWTLNGESKTERFYKDNAITDIGQHKTAVIQKITPIIQWIFRYPKDTLSRSRISRSYPGINSSYPQEINMITLEGKQD